MQGLLHASLAGGGGRTELNSRPRKEKGSLQPGAGGRGACTAPEERKGIWPNGTAGLFLKAARWLG